MSYSHDSQSSQGIDPGGTPIRELADFYTLFNDKNQNPHAHLHIRLNGQVTLDNLNYILDRSPNLTTVSFYAQDESFFPNDMQAFSDAAEERGIAHRWEDGPADMRDLRIFYSDTQPNSPDQSQSADPATQSRSLTQSA